ncbi:hypothetical protein P691DRAFT_457642 [Macrolepiota fuliginosa MF-IS2]|uniref:F-box domain-containing protein n=1 Tax=Macrolepiota fuliginosa MF-IS2 TaxID=1400762 RepID=A0A9P6C676_9AGAR|nr:hypothetical protein P691DRAFT_457642 [Macrolepiota fuliginosa MF-IS2]
MMSELPLPDDVLVEILAHLSPSDIIRTRQACRRLYSASKQRALWLYIMKRVHYAFPAEIDPISLGEPELEHLLVRAEVMDQVWANSCPTRCHREKYESRVPLDMPWCLGAGPCIVLEQEPMKYSWYRAEQMEGPIFSYDATANLGPQQQHLPGFRHSYVERGTDTCFIAHLLRDDSREDAQAAYYL